MFLCYFLRSGTGAGVHWRTRVNFAAIAMKKMCIHSRLLIWDCAPRFRKPPTSCLIAGTCLPSILSEVWWWCLRGWTQTIARTGLMSLETLFLRTQDSPPLMQEKKRSALPFLSFFLSFFLSCSFSLLQCLSLADSNRLFKDFWQSKEVAGRWESPPIFPSLFSLRSFLLFWGPQSWKRRWFVFKGNSIAYYKKKTVRTFFYSFFKLRFAYSVLFSPSGSRGTRTDKCETSDRNRIFYQGRTSPGNSKRYLLCVAQTVVLQHWRLDFVA